MRALVTSNVLLHHHQTLPVDSHPNPRAGLFSCCSGLWAGMRLYLPTSVMYSWLKLPATKIFRLGLARGHDARWLKLLPACLFGVAAMAFRIIGMADRSFTPRLPGVAAPYTLPWPSSSATLFVFGAILMSVSFLAIFFIFILLFDPWHIWPYRL